MKLLAFVFFFVANSAIAATDFYDLEMKLSIDGKYVFSPSMFVEPGQSTSVNHQVDGKETFIDVVASESQSKNGKAILMKFTIGTIGPDGKKTILSTPEVIAKENQPAQLTVGKDGTEQVSLSVVAQRKAL